MKFTLEITGMGNAAFTEEYGGPEVEVAGILRAAAEKIESGQLDSGRLIDSNGNNVGEYRVTES